MKKVAGYKIDEEILKKFNELAKIKAINKSQWIENKMSDFIKEENNNG